jgi:N-acyl-D-aspartate/D-glutamate deacylase
MPDQPRYDLLLRNGTVIDGSGAPRLQADVAILGDRIAAVAPTGSIAADRAKDSIDVAGRVVAPGFIDVHTHDDRAVIDGPDMLPKISQGVTTVVVGNCGISLSPLTLKGAPPPPLNLLGDEVAYEFPSFADYRGRLDRVVPGVNVAALIGHSSLRIGTMADVGRKANAGEIDAMRRLLADSLDAGAIGFSTGLYYKPNAAADADEVAALAELLADRGGVYATHMRDEHDKVLDSLEESFSTARRARVPVVISHHKCAGPHNWGRSRETLPVIEAASKTQPVGLDAYPYTAGSTVLDPDHVTGDIRIMVAWSKAQPEMAGRDLAEIARDWGCTEKEAAVRLHPAGAIYFQMDEADVRRILSFPLTMIGSDGLPHDSHPHPRLWGTFPRVLGHYSRDLGLFPLETAVHKMTGLSAMRFNLPGRGLVREGHAADLVVFDPTHIADAATFEAPKTPSRGLDFVLVNGRMSWRAGETEVDRAGRLLTRAA